MSIAAALSVSPTFNNGSELGRLVSAFDWSKTPLGPLERWPQSLRPGYTRNAIVHNGVLDPGVHLIGKPSNLEQLARKLTEIKDA